MELLGFFNDLGGAKKFAKGGGTSEPMVVEVQYRDGANYKNQYLFYLPKGKSLKIGDDITSDVFGISEKDWYDSYLPGEYDEELDHNILEVQEIRPFKEGDIISEGNYMAKGGKVGRSAYKGIYTMTDGYKFKLVSKKYASEKWSKEEIYGLSGDTEALIESPDDIDRFELFGKELKAGGKKFNK